MVEPEPIDTFRNREQVDAERGSEGRGIDGRMGGVPDGHVARRVDARQIERCHQAGTDHRRRDDERDRLNPAMPNDERRPGREVEHRERNDRNSQRTRDPREDRQHAPERQRGFRAEQRTSARRPRSRPAPATQRPAVRSSLRRTSSTSAPPTKTTTCSSLPRWIRPTRRSATSRHSGARAGRPDLQRRRARSRTPDRRRRGGTGSPQIELDAPGSFASPVGGPIVQRPSRWPGPRCPV